MEVVDVIASHVEQHHFLSVKSGPMVERLHTPIIGVPVAISHLDSRSRGTDQVPLDLQRHPHIHFATVAIQTSIRLSGCLVPEFEYWVASQGMGNDNTNKLSKN